MSVRCRYKILHVMGGFGGAPASSQPGRAFASVRHHPAGSRRRKELWAVRPPSLHLAESPTNYSAPVCMIGRVDAGGKVHVRD